MVSENSFIMRLLQYVREHPGVTGAQLQRQFILGNTTNTISSTLTRLQGMKLIENRGKGGRYSEWYPINFDPVDEEFSDMARWLIREMKHLPANERVNFLARHLQKLG